MFYPSSTSSSLSSLIGTWTVGEGVDTCESKGWPLPSTGRGKTEWPCCCGTISLWLLLIVLSATKFESPVCEGGLMGSRFKNRGLGAIEADERGGAEAGATGRVCCFDIGSFCEGAGYRSAGSNGVISSEATSGREASACLRAFCCGTFSLWLLLIVLSATKFESPVCEGGLMGSRFKNRGVGSIKADERGGAEAGAAGGVCCFDVGGFCDGAGCQ